MRRAPFAALFLLAACGQDEATSVVVMIDAQAQVRAQTTDIRLVVTDLTRGVNRVVHDDRESPRQRAFPHQVTLRPTDDDATRTYRLEVLAVSSGKTLATARLVSGYVANETRYVRVLLDDACIAAQCGVDQTCSAGTCVDATRDVVGFSTSAEAAPVSTSVPNSGTGVIAADGGVPDAAPGDRAASSPIIQVSAGGQHTCSLHEAGVARCWGDNKVGQLGDGTMTKQMVPTPVSGLSNAVEISAGSSHTCARLSTGQVTCWGSNSSGQLGDGTIEGRLVPTLVSGLSNVVEVSAGGSHTCARLSTGQVTCWGSNSQGQLGDGTIEGRLAPTPVSGLSNAVEISAGSSHTCARLSTGQVTCWGETSRVLGGGYANQNQPLPTSVPGLSNAVEISAGFLQTCARLSTGEVTCWGDSRGWSGPQPSLPFLPLGVLVPVAGLGNAVEISAGDRHACARLSTGELTCWGDGFYGQLGDGSMSLDLVPRTSQGIVPTRVSGLSNAEEVSAGSSHTCARLRTGEVTCWGQNAGGQLGNGNGYDKGNGLVGRLTPGPPIVFP